MTSTLLALSAMAFVAVAALAPSPGRAETDYPWCSVSSTAMSGAPSCRFTSIEQCRASQTNGYCERNARIVWQEQQQAAKRGAR